MKKRVIVGLSGGVDSSVAAYLLKQANYDVVGLFMVNWDSAANHDVLGNPNLIDDLCPQEKDYDDALKVAKHIGIPLKRVDFIEEYWNDVFSYFLEEYKRGRTPNPDIMCNKYIKFEAFKMHAQNLNADYIAMGHYARIKDLKAGPLLLRGVDSNKDQSYFLSQLSQNQLRDVLFPIGHLKKEEVRNIAKKAQLPTADKKDSTGICFIGERQFNEFLKNYLPAQPGDIVTLEGKTIAQHQGLMHYTIGQRKGLGIGGLKGYSDDPWFVIGKDLKQNRLLVGQGYHHERLYATHCTLEDVNLIAPNDITNRDLTAKFRYRQKDHKIDLSVENGVYHVRFETPIRAVTPGQSCVFYDGEICLGGGIIKSVFKDDERLMY